MDDVQQSECPFSYLDRNGMSVMFEAEIEYLGALVQDTFL